MRARLKYGFYTATAVVALFEISGLFWAGFSIGHARRWGVGICAGSIGAQWEVPGELFTHAWQKNVEYPAGIKFGGFVSPWERVRADWSSIRPYWPTYRQSVAWRRITVPLWMPLLLFASPSFAMWRRDRRKLAPDCCRKCGYNLTGNVSGVCPECGRAIGPATGAPT